MPRRHQRFLTVPSKKGLLCWSKKSSSHEIAVIKLTIFCCLSPVCLRLCRLRSQKRPSIRYSLVDRFIYYKLLLNENPFDSRISLHCVPKMHLNFIRLVFLCSSLVVHAVTAMPVITLSNAEGITTEDSTFTQGNVGSPENLSTSEQSSIFRRHGPSRNVPSDPSSESRLSRMSSASTLVTPIVRIQYQSVQMVQSVKKLFLPAEVQVEGGWPDEHVFVGPNSRISLKIKIIAPVQVEEISLVPCEVSIDIIGCTVAAAYFGDGNWFFVGIVDIFGNDVVGVGKAVQFSKIPTTTYGRAQITWEGNIPINKEWPFVVLNDSRRKTIGFGQPLRLR
ncbi:hypothetical protein C8R42DRAFT_3277 [Lentinula raphanica]|nr:hypothetical protein C8R42DRAFT_3277 [Lentinula raphanica]